MYAEFLRNFYFSTGKRTPKRLPFPLRLESGIADIAKKAFPFLSAEFPAAAWFFGLGRLAGIAGEGKSSQEKGGGTAKRKGDGAARSEMGGGAQARQRPRFLMRAIF